MDIYKIKELAEEPWRFTLYEVNAREWFVDFCYSPKSYVDAVLVLILTEKEKEAAKRDPKFLIDMQADIQRNYRSYFDRAVNINIYQKFKELNGS